MATKYMLSITEAAEVFGIGENKIRELVHTDKTFPAIKVGTHTRINSGLFKEWLDKITREGRNL